MAAVFRLDHLEVDARRRLRRERVFRDRSNPLDLYHDDDLISRYRFDRRTIIHIIELLKGDIEHPTTRGHSISSSVQVLTTLRYLAKGDFFSEVSDIHGISRSSTSRIVNRVCRAIQRRLKFVNMPRDEDVPSIKYAFHQMAKLPNVLGCIDGTLIPIHLPSSDALSYFCRKGFPAINVQAVCDHQLKFINIVIRWPGSTHDSFVLANSSIPALMSNYYGSWLLGDSGYPLREWLMTPVISPSTGHEERYNTAHCSTRCAIERAFGILKARFRCLHKSGGCLPFSPERSVQVINACVQLHNLAMDRNLPLVEPLADSMANSYNLDDNFNTDAVQTTAKQIRQRLIQRF